MSLTITPYTKLRGTDGAGGLDARLYDICVRTGASGSDATGIYSDDNLLPALYLGPYLELEPMFALVVMDGEIPVGYAVAVPDTDAYVRGYTDQWLEKFSSRYPLNSGVSPAEEEIRRRGHNPDSILLPRSEAAEFPAHLHINILPHVQGRGVGRALIGDLCDLLHTHNVPGVHLGYGPTNTSAGKFYQKIGFHSLPSSQPESPIVGVRLPHPLKGASAPLSERKRS